MAGSKAVTVRIPEHRLRRLMRARKLKSQSDLINTLIGRGRRAAKFSARAPRNRSHR